MCIHVGAAAYYSARLQVPRESDRAPWLVPRRLRLQRDRFGGNSVNFPQQTREFSNDLSNVGTPLRAWLLPCAILVARGLPMCWPRWQDDASANALHRTGACWRSQAIRRSPPKCIRSGSSGHYSPVQGGDKEFPELRGVQRGPALCGQGLCRIQPEAMR